MLVQQGLSATPRPPSIQTPRNSITPQWAEMKNQSRGYGNEAEGKYGHWKAQRQAICHDEEFLVLFPPRSFPSSCTQHVVLPPLQAPLHSAAKPGQQTDPTAATHLRTVAPAAASPRRIVSPSSDGELRQRWISMEMSGRKKCLN